jgi:ABC-type Fe3+-hydroxamate transport system substrate-binding protein
MELRDALGTLHAPAGADARIVSLVPSITELVCELGLSSRLVGRTGFCIHPRDIVRDIPKVGGTKDVDVEKVRALRPSHVILNIDENEKPLAEALARFVPHIVVSHPLAPEDNPALYRLIGGMFGRQPEAEALCTRFEAARAAAASIAWPQRKVLYLIWKRPWMTVARDTYISRTLELFGMRTLPETAQARYPEFDLDAPFVRESELVLLSSEPYMFRQKHAAELAGRPEIRGKPVKLIDAEMTSWYGSRAIAGLDYLRRFAAGLPSCRI